MKKVMFALLIALPLIYFVACNKTSSPANVSCMGVPVTADSAALLKFAGDSIHVTRDTSGVYYQIIDSGTGTKPAPTAYLKVSYTGMLMDHSVFDTATNAVLQVQLYQLIPGWQYGLPKIGKGGRIRLLIPSLLAYGCQGAKNGDVVVIPPNSPVYFDITLVDLQN